MLPRGAWAKRCPAPICECRLRGGMCWWPVIFRLSATHSYIKIWQPQLLFWYHVLPNIHFLIFAKNCLIAYINTLFFLGCLFGNVDLPSSRKRQESFGLGPILPWEQWWTHGKVNCLIKTFKFLSASKPRNIYLKTLQLMKAVMLKTLYIMFWSKSIC